MLFGHIYIYIYIYICYNITHIYIYIYIYIYICLIMYVCMYVSIYLSQSVHIYLSIYLSIYVRVRDRQGQGDEDPWRTWRTWTLPHWPFFLAALCHIHSFTQHFFFTMLCHTQIQAVRLFFFDEMFLTGLRQGVTWPPLATLGLQDSRLQTDDRCGLQHPLGGARRPLSLIDCYSKVPEYISFHNAHAVFFRLWFTWAASAFYTGASCNHDVYTAGISDCVKGKKYKGLICHWTK